MRLPVRQYRCYPLPGQDYDESNFGYVYRELDLDPAATAFVTVDLWNMNCEREPLVPEYGRYWEYNYMGVGRQAANAIREAVEERLAPALQAARAAGLTVIHCNNPQVVARYPDNLRLAEEADEGEALAPREEPWPPVAVREAVLEEYTRLTFGEEAEAHWGKMREVTDFPAVVRPQPADFCICQQAAFDAICRERRVTNLVYAGFLLAHCLLDKPGGLRHTAAIWRYPGYRVVLLRDCTVAQEHHHTVGNLGITQAFIAWLEATGIPTSTAGEFMGACR